MSEHDRTHSLLQLEREREPSIHVLKAEREPAVAQLERERENEAYGSVAQRAMQDIVDAWRTRDFILRRDRR